MSGYNEMAKGSDPVLRDLATIVLSEQTGSRWMMNAAEKAVDEIERLRAERDDLLKANAILHKLMDNREAETSALRKDRGDD